MKLLTLNTHSLIEQNYARKLLEFVAAVHDEKPDIIALQEVSQTLSEPELFQKGGYTIRRDNHSCTVARLLSREGINYHWRWIPIKRGYDTLEEGIAIMSLSPIIEEKAVTVSKKDDFECFKTRKILGIRTESKPDEWFFSVHYGWWEDAEEPFKDEWTKTCCALSGLKKVWLMGDFNSPAEKRFEGYDLISNSGFFDSYLLAAEKDSGITVSKPIDGWRDKSTRGGMRIDQIWLSKKTPIKSSRVIFNGENRGIVSDHYGVIIEY